ncbi:MAG: hypothetical protein AAFX02_07565 [Pseudomonadota bacterium]
MNDDSMLAAQDMSTDAVAIPSDTPVPDADVGAGSDPVETVETDDATEALPTDASAKGYEPFTMQSGFEVDQSALEAALPVFQELGLSQEQGQGLVDLFSQMRMDDLSRLSQGAQTQIDDWSNQIKSEWGAAYDDNLAVAAKAVDFADRLLRDQLPNEERFRMVEGEFGRMREAVTPFRDALNETGAGNHPAIIKFVKSVGEMLSEDSIAPTARGRGRQTIADRWYGGS